MRMDAVRRSFDIVRAAPIVLGGGECERRVVEVSRRLLISMTGRFCVLEGAAAGLLYFSVDEASASWCRWTLTTPASQIEPSATTSSTTHGTSD